MCKRLVLALVLSSYRVCFFCFFQEVSTPTKRKQTATVMDSCINLTPRKKMREDFPASPVEDSPRKSSLRGKLQTLTQTNTVRMSPRKTCQPPSTPTRGQTRAVTPRKGSKVGQTQESGAQIKQKEGVSKNATELQRDTDMLPTIKSCSKTQVV